MPALCKRKNIIYEAVKQSAMISRAIDVIHRQGVSKAVIPIMNLFLGINDKA